MGKGRSFGQSVMSEKGAQQPAGWLAGLLACWLAEQCRWQKRRKKNQSEKSESGRRQAGGQASGSAVRVSCSLNQSITAENRPPRVGALLDEVRGLFGGKPSCSRIGTNYIRRHRRCCVAVSSQTRVTRTYLHSYLSLSTLPPFLVLTGSVALFISLRIHLTS